MSDFKIGEVFWMKMKVITVNDDHRNIECEYNKTSSSMFSESHLKEIRDEGNLKTEDELDKKIHSRNSANRKLKTYNAELKGVIKYLEDKLDKATNEKQN